MTLEQINFAPLEESQQAWKLALKACFKGWWLAAFVLILIVAAILFPLAPPILMIAFTIFIVRAALLAARFKAHAWKLFATANGWQMDTRTSYRYLVPPGLQNIGYRQKLSETINAHFNNIDCDLLTYQYTIGAGKSQQTYYFTIANVVLVKSFPHIILDSKKSWGFRNIDSSYENLKLEGNFDSYFKLYVNRGEEIDVLSIITPDVMQVLIKADQQQDIEIYDNCLYFIETHDQRTPKAMQLLLQSVDKLAPEIMQRAQTLNYQPARQV